MTTNEIIAILQQIGSQRRIPIDWTQVMLAAFALIAAYQTYLAKKTHTAVNSSKTAMEAKIEGMEKRLVLQSGDIATKDERIRGQQDKLASQAVVIQPQATLPAAAAPHFVPAPALASMSPTDSTRMGAAINELAAAAEETKESSQETTVAAEKTEELAREHKTS